MISLPLAAAVFTLIAPPQYTPLSGQPFGMAVSADSRHLYLAESGHENGIVDFAIGTDGKLTRTGFVALSGSPAGIALSLDGKLLAVAAIDHVDFVDVQRLQSGDTHAVLQRLHTGTESIYVAISPDGQTAYVSEEAEGQITVIDIDCLSNGKSGQAKIINRLNVGTAPVGLAFSRDGSRLYTTAQRETTIVGWPQDCVSEADPKTGPKAEGALIAIDTAIARSGKRGALINVVPAGCNPVRVVLGPDEASAYVTARGSGEVRAFDTPLPEAGKGHVIMATTKAAPSPVGVAVTEDWLFIALSDRFSTNGGNSAVAVIDRATLEPAGSIPAGRFPREIVLSPDGQWLLIGNFGSSTVEMLALKASPTP